MESSANIKPLSEMKHGDRIAQIIEETRGRDLFPRLTREAKELMNNATFAEGVFEELFCQQQKDKS